MKLLFKILILFFSILIANGQEDVLLEGQILNDSLSTTSLNIYNLTQNKGTITGEDGRFRIKVQLHDTISISALQFKELRFVVNSILYERKEVTFYLTPEINDLGEIRINNIDLYGDLRLDAEGEVYRNRTLKELGFQENKRENLTAEERRYRQETSRIPHNTNPHAVTLGAISINRILNAFSGKNRKLKKIAAISRLEKEVDELRTSFADSIYVKDFKIPELLIRDFVFWIVERENSLEELQEMNWLQLFDNFRVKAKAYLVAREEEFGEQPKFKNKK